MQCSNNGYRQVIDSAGSSQGKRHFDVCLAGSYGPYNLGDDILMLSNANLLLRVLDPSRIVILVRNKEWARRILPQGIAVAAKNEIASLDIRILVLGGGGLFFGFRKKPAFRHTILKALKMPLRFLVNRSSNQLSVPPFFRVDSKHVAALLVGIGPFMHSPILETRARTLLSSTSFLAVRDEKSLAFCRKWGISNAILGGDLGFIKDLWLEASADSGSSTVGNSEISIVLRDWPFRDFGGRYLDAVMKAEKTLTERGKQVRYHVFSEPTDRRLIRYLRNRGKPISIWNELQRSPGQYVIEMLRSSRLLISARAHGLILSAAIGLPGIGINIEPKIEMIHRSLPNGTMLWNRPFESRELVHLVELMEANYTRYREKVVQDVTTILRRIIPITESFSSWVLRNIG